MAWSRDQRGLVIGLSLMVFTLVSWLTWIPELNIHVHLREAIPFVVSVAGISTILWTNWPSASPEPAEG